QDWIENDRDIATESLSAALSPEDRDHLEECAECRVALEAWLSFRQSLRALPKSAEAPRWLTARVMAAIAAREEESRPIAAWIAIPKFASRLAWISAVVLAFAGTWVYQKTPARPAPPSSVSATEGLFETQPPAVSDDDVLISMAEHDHE